MCPQSTFYEQKSCIPCAENCLECIRDSECSQCQTGYQLVDVKCEPIICPQKTYLVGNDCKACQDGCQACTDGLSCTLCGNGLELTEGGLC